LELVSYAEEGDKQEAKACNNQQIAPRLIDDVS
jgi:hypothetical protein